MRWVVFLEGDIAGTVGKVVEVTPDDSWAKVEYLADGDVSTTWSMTQYLRDATDAEEAAILVEALGLIFGHITSFLGNVEDLTNQG